MYKTGMVNNHPLKCGESSQSTHNLQANATSWPVTILALGNADEAGSDTAVAVLSPLEVQLC